MNIICVDCVLTDSSQRQGFKLDLTKLPDELFYAVPHKASEIEILVSGAIDIFWEKRRYGESWDDVEPPTSYYSIEDRGRDVEGNSRRVYKRLVFDLTAEILREMYQDEEEEEHPSWQKPRRLTQRYCRSKTPPTTSEDLKPVVQEHVLQMLGIGAEHSKVRQSRTNKWSSRKKKDHVDTILVQELRDEEPDWVNYDTDELTVKTQLADAIFESLLAETGKVFGDIAQKKARSS